MSEVLTVSDAKQILETLQALRTDFQAMDKKLDIHIARTDEQFKTLRAEVKAEINELRAEVKAEINELRAEVKAEINELRAEVKAEINGLRADMRGELKALNEKVDALKNDVTDLRTQQRATDGRLWAFVVGLVTLVGGGVIKVLWFDRG